MKTSAPARTKRRMRHEYTPARALEPPRRLEPAASRVDPRARRAPPIGYHEGSARTMATVPKAERPRERLARLGVDALGDVELLALVVGSGTRAHGALGVAGDLLAVAGGVHGLVRMDLAELDGVSGVGVSRAARVLAAIELGRRTLAVDAERPRMRRPADVAAFLAPRFGGFPVERFGVMMLDGQQRVVRTAILSMGSVETCLAHPRDVFRVAAMSSAASVVVFHNHPSGDPTPSAADRLVTERLRQAGALMGIRLMDHVIIGHGRYFSFREEANRR